MSYPPFKVSVLTVTYNHERYIEQAVRSALAQETDFAVEIVVADDCSTDGTREILRRLDLEFPGRLRLLLRDRNLGATANFADALATCTGEYLALLEGDDYWTDTSKLARQVNFLDQHPEYEGTAHVVRQLSATTDYGLFPHHSPDVVTFQDLLVNNRFATCSVLYRRRWSVLPGWHRKCTMGDWPLHILHASRGPFRVFPEVMGVYRIHEQGMWATAKVTWQLRQTVAMYQQLAGAYPEYARAIAGCKLRHQYVLLYELAKSREWSGVREWIRAIATDVSRSRRADVLHFLAMSCRIIPEVVYRAVSPLWTPAPSQIQKA
ncbi:glycosyltransferase family 2 protein [Fimbriiglobus ruber]|uniref:Putative glycosyltransferase n=1 Tax=Fimbriiglobus ruber TaxID=1908690 RepID=A0A225DR44_9BACT|nr:glycosyltransferase [Fimbriiglobus ruber]OWK43960.1 putative glycosyltransferase [Fimbriiglobus ruber]